MMIKCLYEFVKKILYPVRLYLKFARINKSIEEYSYLAYRVLLIVCTSSFIVLFIFLYFIFKVPLLFSLITCFLVSLFLFFAILTIFYMYPTIKSQSRSRKIENALPLATIYMATISTSGANPIAMFEYISNLKEFGELAEECRDIVYYSKVLGVDLARTLEKIGNRSPSREWRDILYNIRTILVEGGDLTEYLYRKSRALISDYKRKIEDFSRNISLFLEIYITLVILGVVFSLIISTILALITPGLIEVIKQIQMLVVIFGLPIASIIFILLIKTISPFET